MKNRDLAILLQLKYSLQENRRLDEERQVSLPRKDFRVRETQPRFYPHHGAGGIRRSTNMYRNGRGKGMNGRASKSQRDSGLNGILVYKKGLRR